MKSTNTTIITDIHSSKPKQEEIGMDSKALAYGIVGFLLGGLVVSIAATQLEDSASGSIEPPSKVAVI
jgi:hypothetical protein